MFYFLLHSCIVAYIEEIYNEEKFLNKTTQNEFKILKFVLNNNYGIRLQCNIFNDNINNFKNKLTLFDVCIM